MDSITVKAGEMVNTGHGMQVTGGIVTVYQYQTVDELTAYVLHSMQSLTVSQRAELVLYLDKMQNQKQGGESDD